MSGPDTLVSPPVGTPEYDAWAADDKGPFVSITCWVFTAIATVFVACRLFVRWRMYRKFKDDDYWCFLGLICAYLSTALTQVAVHYGNGRHMLVLSEHEQERVIFWTIIGICPGVVCLGVPKFAVVSLLCKLMNPSKYHRWFMWSMATVSVLSLFAVTGTLLGQCQPMASQWNFDINGECIDKKPLVAFSIYASVFSAFVDFYLAIYPAVVLFGLQLKLQKKLILALALGIGMVSGAIAIYKATKLRKSLSSADFSYDVTDGVIWTIVEGATIIIAGTIPVLGPLAEFLPSYKSNPLRKAIMRRNKFHRRSEKDSGSGSHGKSRRGRTSGVTDMDLEETIVGDDNSQDGFVDKVSQDGDLADDCNERRGHPEDCTGTKTEVRYSAGFPPSSRDTAPPPPLPDSHHIVRTSEVSVSYTNVPIDLPWPPKAQHPKQIRPPSGHK